METFKEFSKINENINFTNESKSGLEGVKEYKDGLTPEIVKKKYPWLMSAKFKNAVIGEDRHYYGLVWYSGNWLDGTWESGIWEDGEWEKGIWQDGEWNGGYWYDGTWEDGEWSGGVWYDGTWEDGSWEDGRWEDGTWKNGTWYDGQWNCGTWKRGKWRGGEKLNQKTGEFERSDEPPTEDFD